MNARKSPNARTAKDAQQHRLRLIVESVRRGNPGNAAFLRQLAEKTVAQFTRRRLDAGTLGCVIGGTLPPVNRRFANVQFEPVLLRQLRDKARILVRFFSAQLVIDMRDRQHNPQLGPQLQQQAKQRHRVRPTRNRRRHAVARPNRRLFPNCLQQPLRQHAHGEMVQESVPGTQLPVPSCQSQALCWLPNAGYGYCVRAQSDCWVLCTGYLVLITAMLSDKCGEFLAGLLGFCWW